MRIALHIEYEGTNYGGWQLQQNAPSIQGEVERAVLRLTGADSRVTGSGRTDAGVHALGQVAHFDTDSLIPPDKFAYALNPLLPADISIRRSFLAPEGFHARFSATGKHYRYAIANTPTRPAAFRNFCMHVPYALDFDAMQTAARAFEGEHDFASFCAAGSQVGSTVRTVTSAALSKQGSYLFLDIKGNGFLYHMVRILAGTLVETGAQKRPAASMAEILLARSRAAAGPTAPARGLFLVEALYENRINQQNSIDTAPQIK